MSQSGSKRIDVFFYGLFMDEALLREKGLNPINRGKAAAENFALVITQRATLVPSAGNVVHGVVFSLTHAEVDELYRDPSVSMYRPEVVLARLADGSTVACVCFNLPVVHVDEERNLAYATKLRALAIQLNLPESYVRTI